MLASAMSVLAGTAVFGGSGPHAGPRSDESIGPVLLYREPAKEWVEALPVGNGRLGAMVFGGIATERLQLNEDTLWSGARFSKRRTTSRPTRW